MAAIRSPALDVPVLFLPLVMETQQPKTMDDPKNRHKGESLKKTYREYMINAGIVAPSMNLISDRARSVALLIDLLTIYTHRALNWALPVLTQPLHCGSVGSPDLFSKVALHNWSCGSDALNRCDSPAGVTNKCSRIREALWAEMLKVQKKPPVLQQFCLLLYYCLWGESVGFLLPLCHSVAHIEQPSCAGASTVL